MVPAAQAAHLAVHTRGLVAMGGHRRPGTRPRETVDQTPALGIPGFTRVARQRDGFDPGLVDGHEASGARAVDEKGLARKLDLVPG